MDFSEEQILRYSRHILLREIGGVGQRKLLSSSVLVIGAGGLGSIVLMYLTGFGIGRVGFVESDNVDLSNLPRQILYTTKDVGRKKIEAAYQRLQDMNSDVKIDVFDKRLNENNAEDIFKYYDLIVDCTDNFESRFLINRLSVKFKKPLISGAVVRFEGNVMLVIPYKTFCYNCIFEEPPNQICIETCSNSGVFAPVVGTIASIMTTEAVKFILGLQTIEGHLLIYNGLLAEMRRIKVKRDENCLVCKNS
ncbi:MAG: HesA/MoeB/ThiF family protein [Deltaproteobacteria bacterium]|nr:HesA/MoeB/ThiF family protein [Deltaproteobacteria bacterium]